MESFLKNLILFFVLSCLAPQAFACEGKIGKGIGQCAPNFSLTSLDGKTFELKKLLGKVVLVNFWATWCKPCVVEMPSMQKAYQELKKSNVELLAVSIDSNTDEIQKFLSKNLQDQITFPIFFDRDKKISASFGTYQVPETYIIDKTGRITDKVIGIREWDDSITLNYLKLLSK